MKEKKNRKLIYYIGKTFIFIIFSLFFLNYFSTLINFNMSTIFSNDKRGFFNFIFLRINIGEEISRFGINTNKWNFFFALLIFFSYILEKFSNSFFSYYKEIIKKKINNFIFENPYKNSKIVSDTVDSNFEFLNNIFALITSLWLVIRSNIERDLDSNIIKKFFICFFFTIIYYFFVANNLLFFFKKKKNNDNSLIYYVSKNFSEIKSLKYDILFFSFYYLLMLKGNKTHEIEIIKVFLLAMNISTLIGKIVDIPKNWLIAKSDFLEIKKFFKKTEIYPRG